MPITNRDRLLATLSVKAKSKTTVEFDLRKVAQVGVGILYIYHERKAIEFTCKCSRRDMDWVFASPPFRIRKLGKNNDKIGLCARIDGGSKVVWQWRSLSDQRQLVG